MNTAFMVTPAVRPKVLSISSLRDDHQSLQSSLGSHSCQVVEAEDLSAGLALLEDVCVVVCERDLIGGTWKEMLQHLHARPYPPLLIVASRLADERLWAEALNLGAWDVLAKPFVASEVTRSIQLALHKWSFNRRPPGCGHSQP